MRLPKNFKPLFWWCKFSSLDPKKHKKSIIVQTINRGDWWHWRWIVKYYGRTRLKKIIKEIPMSEFRPPALKLICLLLKIKKLKYASRSDYIKTKRNL
jgi:hypothetical protein